MTGDAQQDDNLDPVNSEGRRRELGEFAEFFSRLLTLPTPPALPAEWSTVEAAQTLHADLITLRQAMYEASVGDFSSPATLPGYLGGVLKALQANLRHLAWQARMVASGDFSQRVDFMGEFAEAFNSMVVRLDQTLSELQHKQQELSRINGELVQEIDSRKQAEAALRRSREELQRLATTDPLTGLCNRRQFNQVAEEELERSRRYGHALSVVLFDVDFFKRVNDIYGHDQGDRVLQMVARTVEKALRRSETLARYGGEEFVILLPETGAEAAQKVAERLRRALEGAVLETDVGPVSVTASFGVSDLSARELAGVSEKELSTLISKADRAMYAAKAAGRNRVRCFEARLFHEWPVVSRGIE